MGKHGVKSTTTVVEEDTPTSTTLADAGWLVEQKVSQETTAVETMSYKRLAEAVDKQRAADDVEAGFEKEEGDVSKASEQKVLDESEADEGDDWDLPFDEHQEFCSECRKLGRYCFVCREYREGDDIEEAHMVRFTQAIELTPSGSIEEVQGKYCDEIKPVVGLFPEDWHAARRGKVRW